MMGVDWAGCRIYVTLGQILAAEWWWCTRYRVVFFPLSCSYSLCFPGLYGDPCYPDHRAPCYEVSEQHCNTSLCVKWGHRFKSRHPSMVAF